ncbi:MAG TPA: hypothetical protein VNA13_03640 [Xanthomonadales bacterium]|nr:hypothetical protein [Xanthomonadales bacterium]
MTEAGDIPIQVDDGSRVETLNLRDGQFGFHYTVDAAIPDTLTHGLLSRLEERKRGLGVRKRASRSRGDTVYFTTRYNDIYFLHGDEPRPPQEELSDVVGIAVDRPDFARSRHGHFGLEDFITPDKFRALLIVDCQATEIPLKEKRDTYDKYAFGATLPDDVINARVESLRRKCAEKGIEIPIYGVSGKQY